MNYSATLIFPFSKELDAVLNKINIQIKDRLEYYVKKEKNQLVVNLQAKDITALRTALNAILRNVKVAIDAKEIE